MELSDLVTRCEDLVEEPLNASKEEGDKEKDVWEVLREPANSSLCAKLLNIIDMVTRICLSGAVWSTLSWQSAERAIKWGPVEDSGGADYEAQHYQPIDDEVLQSVPPRSKHLLLVRVTKRPHQRSSKGRHACPLLLTTRCLKMPQMFLWPNLTEYSLLSKANLDLIASGEL